MRQRALISRPSTKAKTRLVLPTSMARIIAARRSCVGRASQLDFAGADDLDGVVVAAEAKRAVRIDPVERAGDRFVGARMDRQLGANGVRAGKPGSSEYRRRAPPPQVEQP